MKKRCFKKVIFIMQFTKEAQKANFWSRIHFSFFRKRCSLCLQTFLSYRILILGDSKHVGTPCTIFRDLVLRNKIKGNTAPYVLPYSKTQKMLERGLLNALKKKQMCKNEILHTFLATNTKV